MVTFLAGRLGCLTVAELQPCKHRFADVYATVVHNVRLYHFPAVSLLDTGYARAEQVVPHVPEVQWLIGVRRRILNHHKLVAVGLLAVVCIGGDCLELLDPERGCDAHVQEALHGIELLNNRFAYNGAVRHCFAYLFGNLCRCFAGKFDEREHYECNVSFKLRAGLLQLYLFVICVNAVQRFYRCLHLLLEDLFKTHSLPLPHREGSSMINI